MRIVGLRLASGGPPSTRRNARGLLLTLLAAAALASGCPDEHVGRRCELGTGQNGSAPGDIMTIASPALECPSGICVAPSGSSAGLCSVACDSNDDCADGELARADDPSDPRCKSGFACMWPTTVGTFACRRLCVCRDLISEPAGGFKKPVVCE